MTGFIPNHAMLLRVARHELGRRRHALGGVGGPELDDLAQQSASDAMMSILAKLDLPPAPEDHRRVLAVLTYLRR